MQQMRHSSCSLEQQLKREAWVRGARRGGDGSLSRLQERKKESLLAEAVLSVEAGDEAGPPVTV